MEFIDISKYFKIKKGKIPLFSELRTMNPVQMTQDLEIFNEPENIAYAISLVEKGIRVIPIQRQPPSDTYINRKTFPRRILFEMTSECNFRCRMCPQLNLQRPRMHMAGELYRSVVDEIDANGIEGMWLYHLGESLLHPEFRENLRHISTKTNLGILWMSTNGQYFTEANIRCVLDSNLDYINFSMHAVTEQTYKTVTTQGDFRTVENNLERFFELKGTGSPRKKPFMHCQMIEQETTRHETDAFIEKYSARADIVSINMLEYASLPNNEFGIQQRDRKPLTSCLRVERNDCFICSNGSVTLCDAAYNGEILLGDINKQSLHEIWNGPERLRILELSAAGKMRDIEFCRSCTDYDI